MDEVFKALADASRRRLLDRLNERNGQTLRDLCAELDMARQSVSKHLAVLEAANLVTTVWRGREKLHYLNADPINAIAERWINQYDRARVHALADLKHALESKPMAKPEFVYTTYIKTTPEELWRALTEPAFTRRYWGVAFETDWRKGSPMTWEDPGGRITDPEQIVLEADPYRRLSYTWHTFTPEWASGNGISEQDRAKYASEARSKVTFDLEPHGQAVKLTVIHDSPEPDSAVIAAITTGWPEIISSLKTLLETGDPNPEFVYTTYIDATPERLWQALTDPALTRRYWGVAFETDWRKGSPMTWEDPGGRITDPEQVVLEADPHRRLSYTWHTFTPEWAAGNGISEEDRARFAKEGRSRVTFDLEPRGQAVKLIVTHVGADPVSAVVETCSAAWPEIISSLKSLLETGDVLATATH